MSSELATVGAALEKVLIGGDLASLSADQRLSYYKAVCESVGLNPLTKPFDYLNLSGRLVLYAKRDATDQLRKIHGVSVRITGRENVDGVYVVSAIATDKSGRTDESTGAVTIANLKGDHLANAFMKAETKAKRRVTLSICGLGLLDETEIETIPNARPHVEQPQRAAIPAKAEPARETSDTLFGLLQEIGSVEERPTVDVMMELFRAMKIEAGGVDDLNAKQLKAACAAARDRINRLNQPGATLPGVGREPVDLSALAR